MLFRTVMLVSLFDGKFVNIRRLQAKFKVQTDVLDRLVYADTLAENAKQRQKCTGLWIECHKHVTTMALQSSHEILR